MSYTRIATGDALAVLKLLPDESTDCCVTSPPYWLARDYGVPGQIGQEPTPQEYVERLCRVFDEVRRVLRDEGTCWVVLGDTYFGADKCGRAKSLASIPSRFEIAMTDSGGWILRNVITWHKPNAIPTSVRDRFTIDYEFVFFFVKSRRYYFDRQLERSLCPGSKHVQKRPGSKGEIIKRTVNRTYFSRNIVTGEFRNMRCVWSIPTTHCLDAHFAVYPERLIEIPVRAGCPESGTVIDPFCGAGTTAVVCERTGGRSSGSSSIPSTSRSPSGGYGRRGKSGAGREHENERPGSLHHDRRSRRPGLGTGRARQDRAMPAMRQGGDLAGAAATAAADSPTGNRISSAPRSGR